MKKIAILLFALVTSVSLYAVTDTQVTTYKNSIKSYLKTEGYTPEIDSDGDVKFKHDGYVYWVTVSAYDDGYYVTVMTYTNVGNYGINKVRQATDYAMRNYKYVRLYTTSDGDGVITSYSWYCTTLADFKRMFSNALNVVSSGDSKFMSKLLDL